MKAIGQLLIGARFLGLGGGIQHEPDLPDRFLVRTS
jgi:hypothetical protein